MELEKMILAVLTTNPKKAPQGAWIFHCGSEEEMRNMAARLESILDGIAHSLGEEIMIIVKH
jgi:hypothetical protein